MPVDSRALLAVVLLGAACVPTDPDPTASGTSGSETTDPMASTSSNEPTTSSTSTSSESSSTTILDPTLGTSSETTEIGSTAGDSSSSGSSGDTASSSSGTTDASSSSTSGESSTGEALETTTDTGDDTEGGDLCETMLMRTHVGRVETHHDGDRFVTIDEAHNLVLWDTATLDVVFEAPRVQGAQIDGGVLVYATFDYDTVHIVDASDGSQLGSVPYEFGWGLATGGGYVWTGWTDALQVYELDGTERWSVAEPFGGVQVLALADTLHVYASQNQNEVLHFSADAGVVDSDVFDGAFGGWFDDAPRYWTTQGQAYRVYDVDNTLMLVDLGTPQYGWGTRVVLLTSVIDIGDPDTVLAQVTSQAQGDGPAVFDGNANLVHLDEDPLVIEPICCVVGSPSFAYADDAWTLGGDNGYVTDHLGRAITSGEVVAIVGSTAGRVALAMLDEEMVIAEVSEACAWDEVATHSWGGTHMEMSGDGSTLFSTERWQEGWTSIKTGTRIYAMPSGELLVGYQAGLSSDGVIGYGVSHDGEVWSRVVANTGVGQYAVFGPAPLVGNSLLFPNISADGTRVAISDGGGDPWSWWGDSVTYFYEGAAFTGVIDGVNHGFIDADHVLVSRYESDCMYCATLLGSDVVDMTGAVVANTSLPDVRDLKRIDDGAALGIVHPDETPAIYDVMNSTVLWEGPPGAMAEVAGPNHVFISTGARVEVVAWR